MIKVEYRSNNSGGDWWLKDEDWKKLEKAGWYVEWGQNFYCGSRYPSLTGERRPEKFIPCVAVNGEYKCNGHRVFESYKNMTKSNRWLDALATTAHKSFKSIKDALLEFERVTGQDVMDEGCNCCGAPHSFSWDDGSCSGDDCGKYLYGDKSKLTKRELLEGK